MLKPILDPRFLQCPVCGHKVVTTRATEIYCGPHGKFPNMTPGVPMKEIPAEVGINTMEFLQ